jgi:hypothetical protein
MRESFGPEIALRNLGLRRSPRELIVPARKVLPVLIKPDLGWSPKIKICQGVIAYRVIDRYLHTLMDNVAHDDIVIVNGKAKMSGATVL